VWKKSLSSIAALAVCMAIADSTLACGPFFPSDILTRTDEQMLAAPAADFSVEIARLKVLDTVPWKAVATKDNQTGADQTADADVRDLRKAMAGEDGQKTEHAVWQLQKFRQQIVEYVKAHDAWVPGQPNEPTPPTMSLADNLKELPAEFQEYERGALAYHNGKVEDARRIWLALLEKPPAERKYRTTWAAYMLGRSYLKSDPEKAVQQFQTMRKLVDAGFADSTGLAVASLGWEAAASMQAGDYQQAVKLYLQQSKAGDPTGINSLAVCAQRILQKEPAVLAVAAKDAATRTVVTACILAKQEGWDDDLRSARVPPWLAAVEAAKVQDMAGADRLAWIAYQAGDMDGAKRWLDRAPKDSAVGCWLNAKLSLRAGDDVKAAEYLAKAAKAFPADEEWPAATEDRDADPTFVPAAQVRGELAVLQLHRSQYVEALDLLLKGNFWADAAYVGERVLTVDELKNYCDTHPQPAHKVAKDADGEEQPDRSVDIRHLLGRRLLRAGKWQGARDYFPERLRPHVDAYVTGLTIGNDAQKSKDARAAALWSAAQVARHWGLGILATELEPDWAIYGGNYELSPTANERLKEGHTTINVPSADELVRLAAQTPPEHRWHYRFVAAEQAWAAAALMPDESEQTAKVLNTAGTWIKNQDPKGALKFWKALTTRCGTTALGKQAKALHWFAPLEKPKDGAAPEKPGGNVVPPNDAEPDGVL
jgi:tetratricopeptide (TPR) repeat protein